MKTTFWDRHYQKFIGGILFCGFVLLLSKISWWLAFAFAVLVAATACYFWLQARIAKRRNAKDFAFALFLAPAYKSPFRERLKQQFPKMSDEGMDNWTSDFTAARNEMGRLASAGGSKVLGKEFVVERLQKKFPFLPSTV